MDARPAPSIRSGPVSALTSAAVAHFGSSQPGIDPAPDGFLLSVVIPVYNEQLWVREIVRRVAAVPIAKEIILVDDGSTDGTRAILQEMEQAGRRVVYQPVNRGKGAAVREGFRHARGQVVVVQDADLEYDPAEYPRLLQPILDRRADVVFGSRFLGTRNRNATFWHYIANKLLTTLFNICTHSTLTDLETGCKVFRREVLSAIRLQCDGFGFEVEVTAKIAGHRNPSWRIHEVPISYAARTYQEGKKIALRDAFAALFGILRYTLFA